MVDRKRAILQLRELESLGKDLRLAADGWPHKWQTLIATLMSARTTDKKTIPVAELLFSKYPTIKRLSMASVSDIEIIIRPVNFYKTKSRNIKELAQILVRDYESDAPLDFDELIKLPGVGRKTANVVLAEYDGDNIGVDTHLSWVSQKLGWTKNSNPHKIEKDLERLFPRNYWRQLNWIVVRFGQTFPSRKRKLEIINSIKKKL